MNERIQELVAETDIWCDQNIAQQSPAYNNLWEQKFAELIVRECIGCCESVISDPVPESVDTWLNGGSQCIQEIKEHFGIKE